ncbi:MAG TPA: 50S ribosomal protein L20 [Candidatus Saccharimonadales bacterium]|nr:50S ribosomal protein L20 [Candidatus Saccharimonadales bacterium]
MRVKGGKSAHRRHKKIRQATKGMTRSNRSSVRRGKQALTKALVYATRDRKARKRTLRALWNARINAAARLNGTTYSKLIADLKKKDIQLNRKILSELAVNEPGTFSEIVKNTK